MQNTFIKMSMYENIRKRVEKRGVIIKEKKEEKKINYFQTEFGSFICSKNINNTYYIKQGINLYKYKKNKYLDILCKQ